MNLKKYISENIYHNNKLLVNERNKPTEILNLYKSRYGDKLIKLPLKVCEGVNLHINFEVLKPLINEFNKISEIVEPKKTKDKKIQSSVTHEIYNNLLIEGYISSRKMINDIVNKKNIDSPDRIIQNITLAMTYISQKRNINKENILFLYKTLTNDLDMAESCLDGHYYRKDTVLIGNNDKGIESNNVEKYMDDLIDYINSSLHNDDDSIYIKAIIIHFYFEFIHPYYDFNGRTGRLLVLWFAHNNDIYSNLAFFSTTIASYREQYLKIFKKTRFIEIVDITYFVACILNMLIKQKYHYENVTKFNSHVSKTFKKELSPIQRDILMFDQAHRDIHNLDYNAGVRISHITNMYKEYSKQFIYREINSLEQYGILKKLKHRDTSYYIEYKILK